MQKLGGTYGRLVLLIGGLLASPISHASTLAIPETCFDQLRQTQIISNKNETDLRLRLQTSKVNDQYFNLAKATQIYLQTLSEINNQMENYKSPLFRYLSACRNDEKECHGKLKPEDPFVQKVFCDSQIFTTALGVTLGNRLKKFDTCANEDYDEIPAEKFDDPTQKINRSCYSKSTGDGIAVYKNKIRQYADQIQWVFGFLKSTQRKINQSLIPEGTRFIVQKTVEELDDPSSRMSRLEALKLYYNLLELSKDFQSCCSKDYFQDEYRVSAYSAGAIGHSLEQSLPENGALTFATKDVLSYMIFREADKEYWKNMLKNQSPLQLAHDQQVQYLNYLNNKIDFFGDDYTFASLLSAAKTQPRSKFKISNIKSLTPLDVKGTKADPSDVLVAGFNGSRKAVLQAVVNEVEDKKFQERKVNYYYPQLIQGLLPYQFVQTARAQALRELQKNTRTYAQANILRDSAVFHNWITDLTCNKQTINIYCKPDSFEFRRRKNDEFYKKIMSGEIPVTYSGSNEKRKYIYSDKFVETLNTKIKAINRFCWENANPKSFTKSAKDFLSTKIKNSNVTVGQALNEKIEDFYKTPRFEEVLSNTGFEDAFEFKPSEYVERCLQKGHAFGNSGSLSSAGAEKIKESASNGPGGVPLDVEVLVRNMEIQEAYVPSLFQIKKSDIESIENDIERHLREEYINLYRAHFYKGDLDIARFLQESAKIRIFAMLSYAVDNPSQEIGKYICYLIQDSDVSEHEKMVRRQTYANLALSGAMIVSLFSIPFSGAMVVLFDTSVACRSCRRFFIV